nr:hypothetical protein [uncultured Roseobacter sp.]
MENFQKLVVPEGIFCTDIVFPTPHAGGFHRDFEAARDVLAFCLARLDVGHIRIGADDPRRPAFLVATHNHTVAENPDPVTRGVLLPEFVADGFRLTGLKTLKFVENVVSVLWVYRFQPVIIVRRHLSVLRHTAHAAPSGGNIMLVVFKIVIPDALACTDDCGAPAPLAFRQTAGFRLINPEHCRMLPTCIQAFCKGLCLVEKQMLLAVRHPKRAESESNRRLRRRAVQLCNTIAGNPGPYLCQIGF